MPQQEDQSPFFSVVIPTFARPRQLLVCLRALSRLEYPRERFEIIVVDDGSPQPLDSTIALFRKKLDIILISQSNSGPAAARNNGANAAKGKYLAFTDDDCAPASDWLLHLEKQFASTPHDMIGGRTLNALPGNPYSSASQLLIDYLYQYFNTKRGRHRARQGAVFFASNNIALPRTRFLEMGGFDINYTLAAAEDRDFCERWRQQNDLLNYAPSAIIHHAHALNGRKFWRQHFNYGRGAWNFHRARRDAKGRFKIEPPSFYINLLLYPFRQKQTRKAPILCALLALSQIANAAGFYFEKW